MTKLQKLVAATAIVSTVGVGLAQIADADTYTVKKGDTLWDIAINNGTTVDQLMQDNNLTSSLIFPGDKLTYNTTVAQVAQAKEQGYYTVVLGDTLGKIANRFGVTVDELVKLNKLSDPNLIYVDTIAVAATNFCNLVIYSISLKLGLSQATHLSIINTVLISISLISINYFF